MSSSSSELTTTSATTAPTTTTAPRSIWPAVPTSGTAVAVVTPNGFTLPVQADNGDGTYVVETLCSSSATTTGTPLYGANVVLDPGHGGPDSGAVGPDGLQEKVVNLAVAEETKRILEAAGAVVVLTREQDQNTTLLARDDLAVALHPQAYISIHHNAEPDGLTADGTPGNETYYQIANPSSKRLAGILWEEVTKAFEQYHVAWVGDTDHGAKYRIGSRGDYYAVLRQTAGIDTVLSEAAFITDPPEEALLATPEFQHVEAQAIANAITRFLTTNDPGSGFVTPYDRTEPAGGGGTSEGCTDPPL